MHTELWAEDFTKQTKQKKVAVFFFGSVMSGKLFHISHESTPRKNENCLPFSAFIPTDGECTVSRVGPDSSVGIETRYGLDGSVRGSNSGGSEFSALVQTGPGAHPAYYTMGTGSFSGVKRPGLGVDNPPSI